MLTKDNTTELSLSLFGMTKSTADETEPLGLFPSTLSFDLGLGDLNFNFSSLCTPTEEVPTTTTLNASLSTLNRFTTDLQALPSLSAWDDVATTGLFAVPATGEATFTTGDSQLPSLDDSCIQMADFSDIDLALISGEGPHEQLVPHVFPAATYSARRERGRKRKVATSGASDEILYLSSQQFREVAEVGPEIGMDIDALKRDRRRALNRLYKQASRQRKALCANLE
jgi:hypothetical protein